MSSTSTEKPQNPKLDAILEKTWHDEAPRPPRIGIGKTVTKIFTPNRNNHHLYITGLRGVLVIQAFFWTYFHTFIPTLTSSTTPGPVYQDIFRALFSVPLWNESLIYNFFIILSMRTIAVSFLTNPTGQAYAATIIRRIMRMVIILSVSSGMATLIFSQIGVAYIDEFKNKLPNRSIATPVVAINGGVAINSIFDLFWLTTGFYQQAANTFWPTGTIWAPAVMFFQSYTVYFIMVILPYTRSKWHVQGLFFFGVGSFWMGYWGWYSATGLFFADVAINNVLKSELRLGWKVRGDWRIPYWTVATMFAAIGIALKYVFVVRPQNINALAHLYPYIDILEASSSFHDYVKYGHYPRFDDWLIITAILTVVELFDSLRYFFSFRPLVWLGERSFSIFVTQSIFFWTWGIKLWLNLHDQRGLNGASANTLVFLVGLLGVPVFSEIFYRLVDQPSIWFARETYLWLLR